MRIYALAQINSDRKPPGYKSTWAYNEFFHGNTEASGFNRYGERPYRPVPLIRNIRFMPEVFMPGISLIVSQAISERLSRFDSVELAPCTWSKVYDLPVDEQGIRALVDRFSVLDDSFSDWLNEQCFDPPRDVRSRRYFEIEAPLLRNLVPSFKCDAQFELPALILGQLPPVQSCARLHDLYPIVEIPPYILFTEAAFAVVEAHVRDPHLFKVYEREV